MIFYSNECLIGPFEGIDTNKYSVYYNCRNFHENCDNCEINVPWQSKLISVVHLSAVAFETLSNIKAYGEYQNRSKQIESQILYRKKYCKIFTIVTILIINFMTIVSYPYGVPQYYTNVLD